MKRVLLKLSGEALAGEKKTGFDEATVTEVAKQVKVLVEIDDEKELRDYKVEQLKFKPRRKKDNVKLSAEELKELSALEDKGGKSKIDDTK